MAERCVLCGRDADPADEAAVLQLTEGPQAGWCVHYLCAAPFGSYYRVEPDGTHTAITAAWLEARAAPLPEGVPESWHSVYEVVHRALGAAKAIRDDEGADGGKP